MATATQTDVVASAEATIAAVQSQVSQVQTAAQTKIASVVSALQAHAAAHQAEVTAAQALIAKAVPAAPAAADEAAAFVLTGASWTQGVVNFLGKNWRYLVGALAIGVIVYAKVFLKL